MAHPDRPRILCVDDEPQVLKSMTLHLRKRYEVLTATSGAEGLDVLEKTKKIAVVLSDMRMPEMDGATFLSRIQQISPDTVRMLLTGETNIELASKAVNEGQIFRFLTKPCPPDRLLQAFKAAMEHHRLITAEKELLQKTLLGSIRSLVDVLAIINPVAFSRARQIRDYVLELAKAAGMTQRWQVEAAALLSQIGYISLPVDTVDKIYHGDPLSWEEETLVSGAPKVAEQLLRNIPRLEPVLEILGKVEEPVEKTGNVESLTVPLGSRILKISIDFDRVKTQCRSSQLAIDTLRSRNDLYDSDLLEIFAKLQGAESASATVKEIPLRSVTVGMILAEEVYGKNGVMIVGRNFEVTETFLERIRHFDPSLLKKTVKVIDKKRTLEVA